MVVYAGYVFYRIHESADDDDGTNLHAYTIQRSAGNDKVADFELTDQSGQPFGMAELKGKVWIASFFFASCPATCRQLNLALAGVQEATPADVMLVSLTCDPDNDTPEQLARYSEVFHADPARWKFLTGDMADLKRAGRDIFKVAFEKQVHSERAFVVDRDGRIRARYSVLDRAQAENMINFIRELDQDTAPGGESDAAGQSAPAEPAAQSEPAAPAAVDDSQSASAQP